MNQNISNQLDILKEKFITYRDLDASWKVEEKKDGYTYHTKVNPQNEVNINRVEVIIKGVDFAKLEQYFSQMKTRALIDPNFELKEILNDGNIAINYGKGQPPIPGVDPRDFVVATKVYKLGQGETLIVNQSVILEAHPPIAGTQRAEMHFNFVHLKQINANEVQLLSVGHVDPKGDIPKILVNKGGAKQSESILKTIEYARTH